MSAKDCFHRDLLSRSICVAACLPEIGHEVRLRSVQTGPASLAPERVPKVGSSDIVVRVAQRTNEVKQQQDWSLVFVDRPETYRITDCLDELTGENVGFDRDLQRRACPQSVTKYGCARSRLDQNWVGRAWHSVLLTVNAVPRRRFEVPLPPRRDASTKSKAGTSTCLPLLLPCCTTCWIPVPHHQHCVLVASEKPRAGTTQRPQESSCVQLLAPPDF